MLVISTWDALLLALAGAAGILKLYAGLCAHPDHARRRRLGN
jgi:hypothetical protein